jgi:two-component sensor histidine kinase
MSLQTDVSIASQREVSLVREANHRIANHLAILAGLVRLQLKGLEKNSAREIDVRATLREVISKIVSLGQFHQHLAEKPDAEQIELGDFLIKTCSAIVSILPPDKRVSLVYQLDGKCRVPTSVAHPLGLLVGEIIMNAVKHAHPTGLRVVMTIACSNRETGLVVEIADDGIGLPEGFDEEIDGGTGFQIIRALAKNANADLAVKSDGLGLSFRVMVPA